MPQVEKTEHRVSEKSDTQSLFDFNSQIYKGIEFNNYLLSLFIPQNIFTKKLRNDLIQFLQKANLCNSCIIPPFSEVEDSDSYLAADDSMKPKLRLTFNLRGLNHELVNKLIEGLQVFLRDHLKETDYKYFNEMEIFRKEGTMIEGENPFKLAYSLIEPGVLPASHPFKTIQCKPPSIATTSAPIPIPHNPFSDIYDSNAPQGGAPSTAQIPYSPSRFSDLPRQTVQMEKPPSLVEPTTIDERTEHNLGELERLLKELPRSEVEKVLLRAGFGTRPRAASTGGLSALFGNRASQSTPPPIESPATPGMNPVVLPPSNGSVVLAVQYEQAQQPLAATSLSRR